MTGRALNIVVCVQPTSNDGSSAGLAAVDQSSVEYAVRQVRPSGGKVLAVSLGDDGAVTALQECLARGVHEIVQIPTGGAPEDGLVTAQLLASAVRNQPADLILCGSLGEGGAHGTVGRELARQLDRPYVGAVIEIEIEARSEPRAATVVQRLERGDRWSWSVDLPLVCGVERALFSPRYLAVKRAQRAASQTPVLCDVTGDRDAAVQAATARGAFVVVERVPPRVRPRKPTVVTKALSAADRMKLMRGGGKTPAGGGGADPSSGADAKHRRIKADGETAAAEIVALLEKKGFLADD